MKVKLEIKSPVLKKNLSLIIIVVTILVSLVFGLTIVKPKIDKEMKLFKSQGDLKQKLETNLATLENLRAIDVEQEQRRLSSIELLIPATNDLLSSLSLIESLANSSQLVLLSNKGGNLVEGAQGYTIDTAFEGDYLQIRNFFQSVAKAKRAIGIKNVAFNQTEDGRITLTTTFFFPLSTDSVKVGSIESVVSSLTSDEERLVDLVALRSLVSTATTSAILGRTNPFAKP